MSTNRFPHAAVRLPNERVHKLMAYVDDELSADERSEVERWLAEDEDAARFVAEIAVLGGAVRQAAEEPYAHASSSFDVTDAVMAAIGSESVNAPRAVESHGASRGGATVLPWTRRPATKVVFAAVSTLAVAAAALLTLRNAAPPPVALSPSTTASVASNVRTDDGDDTVEVDVPESESEAVKVFYLSGESPATASVLVWVDESGGK